MAKAEREAPTDKIAVLDIKEEPGRASMMDCAFFDGSSVGTLDAYRLEIRVVESGWRVPMGSVGRSRPTPFIHQLHFQCQVQSLYLASRTYRQLVLLLELP